MVAHGHARGEGGGHDQLGLLRGAGALVRVRVRLRLRLRLRVRRAPSE